MILYFLVALQIADGGLTYYGIKRLGLREGWAPVAWVIDRFGLAPGLLLTKGVVAGLSIYAATYHPVAAGILAIGYVAVVLSNLRHVLND